MSVRAEVLTWRLASLHVHYQLVLWQELVRHLYCRVHVSACVVAQVDDEIAESFLRQLGKRDEHFWVSGLSETLHLDIASVLVDHVCCRDALLWYVTTCHGEVFHALLCVAYHTDFHLRVLRTLQSAHGFLLRHNLAHKRFAVNTHNLVASQDASLLCRTVLYHVLYAYGVLAYSELNAHTRERTLQIVGHSLCILGADIYRVRVEVGQNLRNGLVDK